MTTVTKTTSLSRPRGRAARRAHNRRIPREELRARIEEAALALFHERGFDATTVDEIAVAANVAKGTLFNFFPTKRAVLSRYYEKLDAFMATELEKLDPARPRCSLAALFRSVERMLRREGGLAHVLFREITQDPTLSAVDFESGKHDLRSYEEFFKRCRKLGSLPRRVNPLVAAELIQDLWTCGVLRWFRTEQHFELSRALAKKLDVLFAGLAGQ